MAIGVKKPAQSPPPASGSSRVSSKHQITIPIAPFSDAGLREGDIVRVESQGRGRVLISRVEDLLGEYAGCLRTGGELGERVRRLRREWD